MRKALRQLNKTLMAALTTFAVIGVSILLPFASASAVSPANIISYQGRILDSNGAPESAATVDMQFSFWDSLAAGNCLWSNDDSGCATTDDISISLTDGLFSENLGDTGDGYASIPDTVFADNAAVYLEVMIEGETLSPRKRVVAAPYALNAQSLDGLDSTDFLLSAGDTATGDYDFASAEFLGASPFVFEGATNDGNVTTFAFTDPSGANTITFQDGSGTVAFLSDITGGTTTLDEAYDNFGANPSIINVDAAEGQTGGLEFSIDAASSMIVDLQSTGDFVIQDAGSAYFTFNDVRDISYGASNFGTFTLTSDISGGIRAVDLLVLTQANDATFSMGENLLQITQSDTDSTGEPVMIVNAGTGAAMEINQTGLLSNVRRAVEIDNAANEGALLITQTGNSGTLINGVSDDGALGINNTSNDNYAFTMYTNNGATQSTPGALFYADNAAFDEDVVAIRQDGTGSALFLNQDGNASALEVDAETTTGDAITIDAGQITTGRGLNMTLGQITDGVGARIFSNSAFDEASMDFNLMELTYDPGATTVSGATIAGNMLQILRDTQSNGNTQNITGAVAEFTNTVSEITGTIIDTSNILSLIQNFDDATGGVLFIDNDQVAANHIEFLDADSDSWSIYSGDDTPSFSAEGGSLYVRHDDSGSQTPGIYLNTSATDLGTTWLQLATNGSITLDEAYTNGQTITVDGAGNLVFNLSSTQDFLVQDAGVEVFTVLDSGVVAQRRDFIVDDAATAYSAGGIAFGVDESTNSVTIGDGSGSNASINFYASDGDEGIVTYNTSDIWAWTGGGFDIFMLPGQQFRLDSSSTGSVPLIVTNDDLITTQLATFSTPNAAHTEPVLFVENDGTAGSGIDLDVAPTTTGYGLDVTATSLTTGWGIGVSSPEETSAIRVNDSTSNDAWSIYTGDAAPAFTAEGGSLFVLHDDSGTGTPALYLNTSGTDTGTTWTQLATGGAVTLDDAYTNGQTITVDAAGDLVFNLSSTQDFLVQDAGSTFFTFADNRSLTYENIVSTTADAFTFNASALTTGDAIDMDISSASFSGQAFELDISNAGASGDGVFVTNAGSGSSIFIDQNGNTGGNFSDVAGGALHISNSGNNDQALTVLSSAGASVASPLVEFSFSSSAVTREVLVITNEGVGDGLFLDQNGNGSSLRIDADSTSANIVDITASALTSGSLFNINATSAFSNEFFQVNTSGAHTGSIFAVNSQNASATSAIIDIDLDNGNNDNDVFILVSDETTNSGTGADTVKARITASGEFLSDVGFTAGGASTEYRDGSITSTSAFTYASPTSFTWQDNSSNTLMTLTDAGSTGNLSVTGTLSASDLSCTDCLDFTELSDSATLDAAFSISGSAGRTFTLTRSLTDATTETGVTFQFTASDTTSGTVFQNGLVLSNAPSTEGLDNLLFLENIDTNDSVGRGIFFSVAAGGLTTAIDASDSDIGTALLFGANDIDGTNFDITGATGSITTAGDIAVNGGDITSSGALTIDPTGSVNLGTDDDFSTSGDVDFVLETLESFEVAKTIATDSNTYGTEIGLTNTSPTDTATKGILQLVNRNDGGATGVTTDGLQITNIDSNEAILNGIRIRDTGGGGITNGIVIESGTATMTNGIQITNGGGGITNDLNLQNSEVISNAVNNEVLIENNSGTDFAIFGATNMQLNLDAAAASERLCHDGVDAASGMQRIADCTGSPGDLAEYYGSSGGLSEGDLVVVVGGGGAALDGEGLATSKAFVDASSGAYQAGVVGAISTRPNEVYASNVFDPGENPVMVALVGRIPVNVTDENGMISAGDRIVASSTAGHGMKATKPGWTVGVALEDQDASTDQIIVFIDASWYAGSVIGTDGTVTTISDDAVFVATGTADSGTQGYDSYGLALRGSGWDGADPQDVDMKLVNAVTDVDDYRLSIRNTADSEVAYVTDDGAMMIAGDMYIGGKLYPSDEGVIQTDAYIYYDSTGAPLLDYMRTNAAGWATGSYDFAEMFPSSQELLPGDVVVFDSVSEHVRKSSESYDAQIAGIVSTRPGFLAGTMDENTYPIALAGRVPTKVTLENGTIAIGDPLTTSSTSGYAMKATSPGPIVGYALEPFTGGGDQMIIAFVNASYYGGEGGSTLPGTQNVASGFTGGSNSNFTTLNMEGSIYMHGNKILSIGALEGIAKAWSISGDGLIKTSNLVQTVIESYQGEKIATSAVTSPDVTITLSGTGALESGMATVSFESIRAEFNDVISTVAPIRVVVTPLAPVSLYVSNKDHNGFTVQQVGGSDSGVAFDWMVTAYRKDFEPEEALVNEGSEEAPEEEEETVPVEEEVVLEEEPAEEPPTEEEEPLEAPAEDEEVIEEPAEDPAPEEVEESGEAGPGSAGDPAPEESPEEVLP